MSTKHIGKQTAQLASPPTITETFSVVGSKEGAGPLRTYFDEIVEDNTFGEDSWEKAESKFMSTAIQKVVQKASLSTSDIQYLLAGDLLNQCSSAHYAVRDTNIPFMGIYGACSTMAEGLGLAGLLVDGGFAEHAVATTSSHFCSAEKQFRFPLEYGGQRTPTAQWTVTGSGAAVVSAQGGGPYITHVTTGKVVDMGISDVNNMGAAMAPAAADTIAAHFQDTGFTPNDYDLIVTGDLGTVGRQLNIDLLSQQGYEVSDVIDDCGCMIYDFETEDVHAGASGCGCSASVFCSKLIHELRTGTLKRLLFVATGALMSPTALKQGETIPCVAHAVRIVTDKAN